jgi:hypothetical protein
MPIFSSGTKTIFQQTSAPTGWTKDTTNYNNHCLRIITGATASFGGSIDFTTAFSATPFTNSPFPVASSFGATTLTAPNLPPHQHTAEPGQETASEVAVSPASQQAPSPTSPAGRDLGTVTTLLQFATTAASPAYGAGSHTHPFELVASGSCGDLSVRYVDVIICSKN